jgi:ATP-dependent Lon protease
MDRIHSYLPGWDIPKVSRDVLTDHFGLVSDFLSECWNQLRRQSRQNVLQGRVYFGGALSGRDTTGVQKTVSGLIKLISPNPEAPVSDEVLEWAVRLALVLQCGCAQAEDLLGDLPPRCAFLFVTRFL